MYDNYNKVAELVDRLDNSFALTGSEVIHIRKVHYLQNTHFLTTGYDYHSTEIHIIVDATRYSLKGNILIKDEVQQIYLTLDSSQILQATMENAAVLMVDKCQLIRAAARELYKQTAA